MGNWIKKRRRAIVIFIIVFLSKIEASFASPLPGSDSGSPAKVKEKTINTATQQPSFVSAQANNSEETFDDLKKGENSSEEVDNPSEKDIQALKFLREAKMVKDLNSDSQKLFKDYLKKKVPSINIDELPMNDFEKSYLRGVLPKVIEKPKFAESYFDSVLLWGKIQNVSLMDIVESFGGSEEDYHSYIKNLNTKSDSVDTNIEQESEAYDSFESESYDESES